MSAKNFRLLLPALALACMATFAFADEGQAAQHVADGMPVVADHVDHMGVLPGTLVARNDNGRHEGWYKDKPVPRDTTKRGPLPVLVPGTIAPATVLAPVPAITVPVTAPVLVRVTTVPVLAPTARGRAIIAPVTVPAPAPASMTDAARAMMVPAPARVPAARGPIIGLTVPVPARALSFSG